MANPRSTVPPEMISFDRRIVEYDNALTLGSIQTGISRIFDTVKAEKITILSDIQSTGSILIQKSIGHTSTGSWETVAEIVNSGLGSLVLSPDTIGVIPNLRFTGSSLDAGSVLVSLYWRAYN